MAQIKTRGDQLNIQDAAFDISNDTTSITAITSGLTTDTNSRDVLYNELALNDIVSNINANTVTDVYIYDTSNDDDGGAWVDKANNQSWYTETLNTANRGATRAFPKLALITAESGTVTIYDATDASCPMWIVFNRDNVDSLFRSSQSNGTVVAKNGSLYLGSINTAFMGADFINDTGERRDGVSFYGYNDNIANRNNASGWYVLYIHGQIIHYDVYDIAVTSDGNGNNIVYVATADGASRIDVDNSISNWDDNGGVNSVITTIDIFDGFVYFSTGSGTFYAYSIIQPVNLPLINSSYLDSDYYHFTGRLPHTHGSYLIPVHYGGDDQVFRDITNNAIAARSSLTKLYPTPDNWGNSMIANITTDFNSGIMPGDIRGAWLADTTEETIAGTEIVVDGVFTEVCDVNWTCSGFIWTISGGTATMVNTSNYDPLSQILNTVVGTKYNVSFQVNAINNIMSFRVNPIIYDQFTTVGTHYYTFVATSTTHEISFARYPEYASVTIDNVSVVAVEQDRSYNNNDLAIIGSITKSPVATGAELQAYSGFSASNYLKQEHNADLDFGTGDFYVMGWFKQDVLGNYDCLISKSEVSVTTDYFLIDAGLDRLLRVQVGNTLRSSATVFTLGEWHFVVVLVQDNIMRVFIDMNLQISGTVATVTSSGNAVLQIGQRIDTPSHYDGDLTLWKMGGGAPTLEQFQTIYDQEKLLFFADTKCTLQGSSTDIQTVDYDKSTNVLTACSLNHITKFNDLVVIDDRAEVVTSISTKYSKELTGV